MCRNYADGAWIGKKRHQEKKQSLIRVMMIHGLVVMAPLPGFSP
jgi:hypothetical protein